MAVSTPPQVTQAFAASGTANTIPVPSQIGITPGAASFTDGFPPVTAEPLGSGGVPPSVADMNGILKMTTAHIAYIQSGAGYPYNSTIATAIGGYNLGATLLAADGSGYWINLAANNTTNPDSGGANWAPLYQYGLAQIDGLAGSNVTLNATQYGKSVLELFGTLTANINLIFPAIVGTWVVVNATSGNFTITCKTASGTGATVSQGGWPNSAVFQGDGTNLYTQSGSFVTQTALNNALTSYVTSQALGNELSGYVTQTLLTNTLTGTSTLPGYVNNNVFNGTLESYATLNYLGSTYLSASTAGSTYLTQVAAASTYVTSNTLSTALSAYVTATNLTTRLSGAVYLSGGTGVQTIYESTSAPTSSQGNNGDIWIQHS